MKSDRFPGVAIELPDWIQAAVPDDEHSYPSDEERMRLALTLAYRNVAEETGGPFGAAIFDGESGRLVGVGVNLVVPASWSGAHAEMVAFAVAQRRLGVYDLGAEGVPPMELFTSTEPCAMCLGATFWAGVRRVVCAARGEDAEAIGFDEGPKPVAWVDELERRGISVTRDLLRDEGRAVLEDYLSRGGELYNGRRADAP